MKIKLSRRRMLKLTGSLGAVSLAYASGGLPLPGQKAIAMSKSTFFSDGKQINAPEIRVSRKKSGKKALIIYASRTGNTKKVAEAFHKGFLKAGWTCDIFRITKKINPSDPPFSLANYDALFVGSGTLWRMPYDDLVTLLREEFGKSGIGDRKIVPGPRVGVAFATNGGAHLGPKEAEANLKMLEIEFEHLGFKCVGSFSCPGNMGGASNSNWYWGDISDRPNARDLADAGEFVEQFLQLDEVMAL